MQEQAINIIIIWDIIIILINAVFLPQIKVVCSFTTRFYNGIIGNYGEGRFI